MGLTTKCNSLTNTFQYQVMRQRFENKGYDIGALFDLKVQSSEANSTRVVASLAKK
mgnify:CR=1 FL=1